MVGSSRYLSLRPADRVLAVDGGRVVCDGPPAAYLDWAARNLALNGFADEGLLALVRSRVLG